MSNLVLDKYWTKEFSKLKFDFENHLYGLSTDFVHPGQNPGPFYPSPI